MKTKTIILAFLIATKLFAQADAAISKPIVSKTTTSNRTNKSNFIGKWKDENAIFKLNSNGTYSYFSLLQNGANRNGKWSVTNDIINLNGLFEMEVLSSKHKSFSYRLVGGQTVFNAKKQIAKRKRKHHKKRHHLTKLK